MWYWYDGVVVWCGGGRGGGDVVVWWGVVEWCGGIGVVVVWYGGIGVAWWG